MKKMLRFILISVLFSFSCNAMMHKLRLRHSRSYCCQRKPLVKNNSTVFSELLPLEMNENIITMMLSDGDISIKNTLKGINSLAQTNKFLNGYINDAGRTLDWIKKLSEQFSVSNETIAFKICTQACRNRFVLQTAALAHWDHTFDTIKKNLEICYSVGLDLDFTYDQDSSTLLMKTAGLDYHPNRSLIVEWLLEKGADINIKNALGQSVTMKAFKNHFQEGISVLLQCTSLNVNDQGTDGNTLLHYCIYEIMGRHIPSGNPYPQGFIRIQQLLKKGANPTMKNNKGQTALQFLREKKRDLGPNYICQITCPAIIGLLEDAQNKISD